MALKFFDIHSFVELDMLYRTMQKCPAKKVYFVSRLLTSYFSTPKKCQVSETVLSSTLKGFDNTYCVVPINPVFDKLSFGIKFIVSITSC